MTAQALQRTSAGEGLLISGELPPVIFRQRRHYLDRGLRRLKGTGAAAAGVSLFAGERVEESAPPAVPGESVAGSEPPPVPDENAAWDLDAPPWLEEGRPRVPGQ
jgi:hypothetical protein